MALQWTPLRRRGGAVVRARQNVQTLEHQTQANVLLAFKLSMVSGNGVSAASRPNYRTYRKMADIGVQCDPLESDGCNEPNEPPTTNSTVAEINTSAQIVELDSTPPVDSETISHRAISIESSSSSSSSGSREERVNRKPVTSEDLDVDAIFVQQSATEEASVRLNINNVEKTEPDSATHEDKEESTCALDCLYFTMQCCECTIL